MMIGAELPACPPPRRDRARRRPASQVDRTVACRRTIRSASTSWTSISRSVPARSSASRAFPATGRQELLAALSGETTVAERDAIRIGGTDAGHLSPAARRALGLAFVPEDRLGRGAVPELSLTENALLTASRQGMVASGLIRYARVKAFAERCIAAFDVRCGGRSRRLEPLRRQSAEVHRRPRDPAAAARADRRAADLGRRCRRGACDPPGADRPARRRRRHPGDLGGARRAVRDLPTASP